jgi:hypothetical protein
VWSARLRGPRTSPRKLSERPGRDDTGRQDPAGLLAGPGLIGACAGGLETQIKEHPATAEVLLQVEAASVCGTDVPLGHLDAGEPQRGGEFDDGLYGRVEYAGRTGVRAERSHLAVVAN